MIEEIENSCSNIIDNKKTYFFWYMFVLLLYLSSVYVLFLLHIIAFYWIFLSIILIEFMIYIIILKELKIKVFSFETLKIKKNYRKFKKYKYNISKNKIISILRESNSFTKEDIVFLIAHYSSKKKKEIYRDWISILISIIVAILPYFFDKYFAKNFSEILAYIIAISIVMLAMYIIYNTVIKKLTNQNMKYEMYETLELMFKDIYFEINKEKLTIN